MWYRILILLACSGCSVTSLYNYKESCGAPDVQVDVIAERDGQKLRGFILDALRDLRFTKNRYRLTITLAYNENTYAYSPDGNANRLQILYIANVILRDARGNEIFSQPISTHTNVNIADGHGEVLLALYGRNNSILLRELSNRIIQNIRVFLKNEN